mgnify:FL=1
MSLVQRHKVLAFFGVTGESTTVYHRMKKFTQLAMSKNPIEYNRQYVDEPFQENDIVGYSPSIAYAFDRHTNDPVQADIISITDGELLGDDAVRTIITVDTSATPAVAYKREYTVIPSSEGDNINVYTYSGTLKVKGEKVKGTATSSDDWQTVTFSEDEG